MPGAPSGRLGTQGRGGLTDPDEPTEGLRLME
jgi:hypothetical protein